MAPWKVSLNRAPWNHGETPSQWRAGSSANGHDPTMLGTWWLGWIDPRDLSAVLVLEEPLPNLPGHQSGIQRDPAALLIGANLPPVDNEMRSVPSCE
jgi:hypothetical protein